MSLRRVRSTMGVSDGEIYHCDPHTFTVVRIETSPIKCSNDMLGVFKGIVFATRLTNTKLSGYPRVDEFDSGKIVMTA